MLLLGFYRVYLDNFHIQTSLTASTRIGVHQYQYDNAKERKVKIDLGFTLQQDWGHKPKMSEIKIVNDHTIEGVKRTSGWAYDHRVAFRAEFSEPFVKHVVHAKGADKQSTFAEERDLELELQFDESNRPLTVKVAISPVDVEGAAKNMIAEGTSWDFNVYKKKAEMLWEKQLSSIQIETKDLSVKRVFYTALYHSMIAPFIYQDVDGRFLSMKREVKKAAPGQTNYSVYSLWDTFRALHPLLTIIEPKRSSEFAANLVRKSQEGGILPKWPLASNYTGTMVGYPAVSVLADAVAKNLYHGDPKVLMNAVVKASTYRPEILDSIVEPRGERVMSKHIYYKEKYGIIPTDSISKSVSNGLEMSYYDWCISTIAKNYDAEDIAKAYQTKAEYYKNYFDRTTGFMRGKNADGSWRTPFDPKYSSHEHSDYTEGNAYQWSFLAPHDPKGLVMLYGGEDRFEAKLDTLFHTSSEISGKEASGDITGLIGQYAHGNEPSHHMAYLYLWTHAPYKTAEILDEIMHRFYPDSTDGIIGNEDCGQMSAWYVMNALGFYQVCPGDPVYHLGRPLVDKASIKLNNKMFDIIVYNNNSKNIYIQKVLLNGTALQKPFFTHQDLVKGGKIEFFMGDTPKASLSML
ncbi:GH92 family glycosyl hydrolase [Halosquirtibacter laminarini]|uniref:GH92 family glycosyl hydrolase n=1 Tax=Halosquirtibacter laminarini TaxID=3374600 RepID=A0AC61NPT4_9BACT|nr:GH92 family glycosyl hydrolase [Prolixibacteraceae bacterium]